MTRIEKTLKREQRKNHNLLARKSGEIALALKLIAKALGQTEPTSYAAYRLRRSRFRLLKNRGIAANMTYPRPNNDIDTTPAVKVQIRHLGRFQTGTV